MLAAGYMNQAEYLTWLNPRIRSYDQYLLRDPAPSTGSMFDTGLEFSNGQRKPYVYDAFRMPLFLPVASASTGHKLEVWGCARPAPAAHARTGTVQHVAVQFAAPSEPFRTLRTVALARGGGCYLNVWVQFPHSGSVRLAWHGPGGWIYSRTQSVRIS